MGSAIDVRRARLASHRLIPPHHASPVEAVRAMVAVQAQDYAAGLWAIGQRAGATRAAVEAALADRSLVRTWPMRGTLHVVAAEDARWMLALLAPRVIERAAGRYRDLGLDDKVFGKSRGLFEKRLAGGVTMTRAELFAILERAKISAKEQRGIHILGRLAMEGVLCFGAHRGKQPTFALLDEWLAASPAPDGDAALGELARRYFAGHGPATIEDFAWWSGLPLGEARRAHAIVAGELASHRDLFWVGNLAVPARKTVVHLLSAWDEYAVGYRDRSAILDAKHATATLNALAWCVAVDGRIAGTWKRDAELSIDPIAAVPAKPLAEAKARYRRYAS